MTPLPTFTICEDFAAVFLARVLDYDGALLTIGEVSDVTYAVYDLDNGKALTGSGSLVSGDVLFDTEQHDESWPYPSPQPGYNFRALLPASCFPAGGHEYQVQFALAATEPVPLLYRVQTRSLLGD